MVTHRSKAAQAAINLLPEAGTARARQAERRVRSMKRQERPGALNRRAERVRRRGYHTGSERNLQRELSERQSFLFFARNPLKSPDSAKGIQRNPSFFPWFYLDSL